MKKYTVLLITLICISTLIGCGKSTSNEKEQAKITGDFVVIVRDIIPDYCLDNTTPTVAVVTLFQDSPFTIYVGEEMASQLEINEFYSFKIEEQEIGKIDKESFDKDDLDPRSALPLYNLKIKSIEKVTVDEYGLDSINLIYEAVEE